MRDQLRDSLKELGPAFGIVGVLVILIGIAIGLSLQGIVHRTLQKEAEKKAILWVNEFTTQVPELMSLAENGIASAAQIELMQSSLAGGEIFRFNFFSLTGALTFISDAKRFENSGEHAHSAKALAVISSQKNDISVKYGSTNPSRPETFVEAYIPAVLPAGQLIGVIEVYVDVSSLASTLKDTVRLLGTLLLLVGILGFLIPSLFLIFKNRQIENSFARENWLSAILDHAPFEVVIKNTEGEILAISRNVTEQLKLKAEDFIGKTTADFLPSHIANEYMEADLAVVRTGLATQKEVVEDVDGTIRYSLSSKFPLTNSEGKVSGICSITNDITELKASQARLAQSHKMETVGQLTGGIAHDFNNLLSVVSGCLQLLESSIDKEADQKLIHTALQAIEHGSDLTNHMLAMGRRSPLMPKPTELNQAVSDFENFFLHILPANINLQVKYAPDNTKIVVDSGMLQNALLNVGFNSSLAIESSGKIMIFAGIEDAPGDFPSHLSIDRKCAVLRISDDGKGIPNDKLDTVFEPFFTTRDVGKGSGLGLSMVKGFIEQSNGVIQLKSSVGKGTTLSLFLPLTNDDIAEAAKPLKTVENLSSATTRKTILVIEDNIQLLDLITTKLERSNYRVVQRTTADAAMEILSELSDIDLILTDAIMPGTNQGTDVLRQAKLTKPHVPVFLMSGHADTRVLAEENLRLADRFLKKPLVLKDLIKEIEHHFVDV